MAKTKISQYDTNPSNNTDIDSVNIDEGCAPSGINNAIREVMAHIKDFQSGTSGDSFTSANVIITGGSISGVTGVVEETGSTGSAQVPNGTTAQRDAAPATGYFRFNTTLGKFEGFNGSVWGSVGGGATGGGADGVFIENDQTVTTSYTITSGKNAGTFGPIAVSSGVVVTVPSGSVWTIV